MHKQQQINKLTWNPSYRYQKKSRWSFPLIERTSSERRTSEPFSHLLLWYRSARTMFQAVNTSFSESKSCECNNGITADRFESSSFLSQHKTNCKVKKKPIHDCVLSDMFNVTLHNSSRMSFRYTWIYISHICHVLII